MGVDESGAKPPWRSVADVLAIGFGVSVGMWFIGYVGRLPSVMAPGAVLVPLFLVCLLAGGWLARRFTDRGWTAGIWVGLVSGLVNLLVLGSLLGGNAPNRVVPAAVAWLPGFILASAALGWFGGLLAGRSPGRAQAPNRWAWVLACVAVGATLLLLAVGGLVTSRGAGLAVVDWPNSYGYNMFLYPLSRMTGGIYYEHAHRLFGALVGLTTLILALVLQRVEDRGWVKALAWVAVALVVTQGILGGLRVTGRFTLSASPEDVAPSLGLAIVHGVLAQLFLGVMVALAAFTSATWRSGHQAEPQASARADRALSTAVLVVLLVQLVLGAVQRHLASGLVVHISMAVLVAALALTAGARAWGLHAAEPILRRLGRGLIVVTSLQVLLGIGAFAAVMGGSAPRDMYSMHQVTVTTAHQWCGAILLAGSVLLVVWTRRLLHAGSEGSGRGET